MSLTVSAGVYKTFQKLEPYLLNVISSNGYASLGRGIYPNHAARLAGK